MANEVHFAQRKALCRPASSVQQYHALQSSSLDRDLRELTAEQWEAWVRWESQAFSLTGLWWRQGIVASQLRHSRPATPVEGLGNLQIHFDVLSAAVSLQKFGDDDGWRAFKSCFHRLRRSVTATTGV